MPQLQPRPFLKSTVNPSRPAKRQASITRLPLWIRKKVQSRKRKLPGRRIEILRKKTAIKKTVARRKILSTGILRRNPNTSFALVDVVNLTTATVGDIAVEVFDWSSGSSVPLMVQPCDLPVCKVTLSPRSSDFLYADVSSVEFKYEVRITLPRRANVLVNVTGVGESPFTPQVGDNVLQHSLVEIRG